MKNRYRARRTTWRHLGKTAAAILIAWPWHSAWPQDASAGEARLPASVVVGTTPIAGLGTPLNQVPSNVQVIRGSAVEAQHPSDITEYLEHNLSSVTINSAQGNAYQPDVSYRGFTASPLLGTPQGISVFQDGVRINEPFGDVVNWDLLPQSAIKEIQVIPGSNPLFGLNTLGGALAITTRSGLDTHGGNVEVTGGSFGRRRIEFEQGGRHDALDYFVTANHAADDGWAQHNASRVDQLFGKIGYHAANTRVTLSLTAADNNLQGTQTIPRSFLDNFRQAYTYPDQNLNRAVAFNLSGTHFFNDETQLSANAYYRKYRNQNTSSNVNGEFGNTNPATGAVDTIEGNNTRSIIDQQSYGFGAQLTRSGHVGRMRNQFAVGVSGDFATAGFTQYEQNAQFDANRLAAGIGDYSLQTDARTWNGNVGVFATDTLSLTEQLALTVSARYNHAQTRIADESGMQPLLNGDHAFTRINPAIGVTYDITPKITTYASYSEGMRAPTAIELACADPAAPCSLPNDFIADPALAPVISKTFEAGARGKIDQTSSWRAAIFRTDLDNDIAFISSSAASSTGFFQNVGKTRRQGIELSFETKIGRLGVTTGYSYIDATYRTGFTEPSTANSGADSNGNIAVRSGNRIPGIPRHTLKLRLDYPLTPKWKLGANIIYRSAIFARGDENNRDVNGTIAGYAIVNLDATYQISKQLQLFARINNVFDKRYANFGTLGSNFFNGPGHTFSGNDITHEQFVGVGAPRAIWVGLRYAWR